MSEPKIEPQEVGSIKLDTNRVGHIFIDQDDKESPFGTRVILTPVQALQVVEFIAQHAPSSTAAPDEFLRGLATAQEVCQDAIGNWGGPQRPYFTEALSRCWSLLEHVKTHKGCEEWVHCQKYATEQAGSPAAPTPHMSAAEFRKTYTGDPLVIGNAMDQDAVYLFAEAYAASETARADEFKAAAYRLENTIRLLRTEMNETIYVLVCSGKYTETINGKPETADNVELVAAFADKDRARESFHSCIPDVKEPEKWGVRAVSIYPVEVTR